MFTAVTTELCRPEAESCFGRFAREFRERKPATALGQQSDEDSLVKLGNKVCVRDLYLLCVFNSVTALKTSPCLLLHVLYGAQLGEFL